MHGIGRIGVEGAPRVGDVFRELNLFNILWTSYREGESYPQPIPKWPEITTVLHTQRWITL